ncbi:hypothetical protein CBER1_05032 [Cercospora berteroae]|uniref:Uncharacterized protein n=1 Tax=Cercospora berteroae TaxID=357750 RepID=A0A2S6BRF5_9PEZI|nr:hypothetical protein CBER1_05032 [Cercospora berteroae]
MKGASGTASAPATAAMPGRQITMAELVQIRDIFGFIKVDDVELGEARARASGQAHQAEAGSSAASSSPAASNIPPHNEVGQLADERVVLPYPPIAGAEDRHTLLSAPAHAQQPVNNVSQDLLTTAANNTAPRKKNKVGNTRHIKSTVNVVAEPHHTKLGAFAGMTMAQLFNPGNGIDIDTFFGAKALYITAHITSPKRVEAMINEKHQIENNTDEVLVKEKLFNHRLKNALEHKFGPNNVKQSKAALKRAQKDDQARWNYIAMLQADDISESNPLSICTLAGCPRNYARSQASQSNSSASTPAASSSGIAPAAGANLAPVFADETSSGDQMSAPYAASADTISGPSTRLRKRTHDSESTGSEPEPPMKTGSKRRKMSHGGVKDGEQQMGSSYTPSPDAAHSAIDSDDDSSLDPVLREQCHSATCQHQSTYTPVAAPAVYSDHAVSVRSPSTAAAAVQHHSSPPSDARPASAINATGRQASTVTENAHTSEQDPEISSGLSPHGAGSISSAPYYHDNSGALVLSGQDVYITISPEQLEEFHRDEKDAFLRGEFVNKEFRTAPDQPFDSDADWGRHVGNSMPELYPELGVSDHDGEGDSVYNA